MKDAEIIKLCREFRKGLLGKKGPQSMCFAVCFPLTGYLGMFGVHATMWESDLGVTNHIWLKLEDGRCLDPTADQFNNERDGRQMPDVYLGPIPVWYQMDCWDYAKPPQRTAAAPGQGEKK